jgi:multidrug resistance efflux pump
LSATDSSTPLQRNTESRQQSSKTISVPGRAPFFVQSLFKTAATFTVLVLAGVAALVIWSYYVTAPWTRDGRIRVQVASIAPQVSGQIVEMRVADNQFVRKGDILYVIDPLDFQVAVDQAKQQLAMRAADAEVKEQEAERREKLSDLATSPEEQQRYIGNATQAHASFEAAQSRLALADINLKRTQVRSPVNGFVTNLLMRVGDYARAGTTNVSVIDAESYWIDGYFEETKLAGICIGDRVEAQLMGYAKPIQGRVDTITRGIGVSDAAPGIQGLPNVDPIYTWVRLAQRVPIRIAITDVPVGVALVSGLTVTVTIRNDVAQENDGWVAQRWLDLVNRMSNVFRAPQPRRSCIPPASETVEPVSKLVTPGLPPQKTPDEVVPDIAQGLKVTPR